MSILRDKRGKPKIKVVNLWMPIKQYYYFNLYALAKGTTRAYILRNIIGNWERNVFPNNTEEMLIDAVIVRIETQWDLIQRGAKTKAQYKSFDDFLNQIEDELPRKEPKIDPVVAKVIIQRLHEKNKEGRYSH